LTYQYTISTDTANGIVALDRLNEEIASSIIVTALDSGLISEDTLRLTFKADLSANDEASLTTLVANHTGEPLGPDPESVTIANDVVPTTKPAGDSATYISHNFASDGQPWLFPHLGVDTKVYKAEVQFTDDVIGPFNSDPSKKLIMDVMVNGVPVLEQRREFSHILDIFDLGNAHYHSKYDDPSMGGGVTTVEFDYIDAIQLVAAHNMSIRFSLEDGQSVSGTRCTISLIAGAQ